MEANVLSHNENFQVQDHELNEWLLQRMTNHSIFISEKDFRRSLELFLYLRIT